MPTFKKALFLIGSLIGISMATASTDPDLNSVLVMDDFKQSFGAAKNQTTLGAIKGWAQNGRASSGNFGYWYQYSVAPYSYVIAGVSTHDTISSNNTALMNDGGVMHFQFKTKPDTASSSDNAKYPSAEVSCDFYGKADSIDLSKMTAIHLRIKGTGTIRVSIKSQNIGRNDWGYCGDTVKLSASFTSVDIPIAKLKPAPYSKSEGKVTWADSRTSACGFQMKTENSKNAEVYVDSVVFVGMKYSDVMAKVGVMQPFAVPMAYSNSTISINNGAVAYTVAEPQNIAISLFNASGKMVKTVYSGYASAGTHSIALPHMNAGEYFVRMNNVESRKFTIVK
jgi:hypothetical protein